MVFGAILGICADAYGQVLTDTSNGTLTATLAFGTLTAGTSNTPDSQTIQFRIRGNNPSGYNLRVQSATFTPTASEPAAGGDTISASDVGIGVISITPAPNFSGISPRNDVIAAGFAYDPAAVQATNGLTPFSGLSGSPARATVQDLISGPNTRLLGGNRIHVNENVNGTNATTNYLTVTLRVAVLRQYFTPATFSGTITLRMSNGNGP